MFIIFILYICLIISAIYLIFANNPIHSIISLILIFLNTSIILILLNIDFIGLMILIVYIGAIAVLFLFIIMMLNLKNIDNEYKMYFFLGIVLFSILFIQMVYFFLNNFNITWYKNIYLDNNSFNFLNYNFLLDESNMLKLIKKLGCLLFLEYYITFFFCGIILFVSMIGCIFLTNFKKGYIVKTQNNQLHRKNNLLYVQMY